MKNLLIAILFLALPSLLIAQKSSKVEILNFHSNVDDKEQPYSLYFPKNYNQAKKYPFVVMLHGAGSNHKLSLKRVFGKTNLPTENDVEASLYFPAFRDVDYLVAAPLARGTMGYQGVAEKDVWDMIADVKKRCKVDENKMYLTGLSMGGGGTLWCGLTRSDVWAALAPVCPAPPQNTKEYLDNFYNKPIAIFQGADDPVVKAEITRDWRDKLIAAGAKVEYTEFPGVKHDSWVQAYENAKIFDWFSKFTNNPLPKEVKLSTESLKYSKMYWIKIEEIDPKTTAKVHAIASNGEIKITSSNTQKISINSTILKAYKVKKLYINNSELAISSTENEIHIQKVNDKWQLAPDFGNSLRKTDSLFGPMTDIISDRHIYVYGTLDNPSKEELEYRKKTAEDAANWSFYRGDFLGRVMVFPRVLSDKEVRENDIQRSHLVLFGTQTTNAMIQKFGSNLPLNFKDKDPKNNALVFVYPVGNKYILVNSGIPFSEIPLAKDATYSILRMPGKWLYLHGQGDYLFYKSDNKEFISGVFDQNWKLSLVEQNKLEKEGIINK
ncbi:MAG: dienelactone hydrolase family protein [Leadbetterella sp.]